jgi:hypothetical protein
MAKMLIFDLMIVILLTNPAWSGASSRATQVDEKAFRVASVILAHQKKTLVRFMRSPIETTEHKSQRQCSNQVRFGPTFDPGPVGL